MLAFYPAYVLVSGNELPLRADWLLLAIGLFAYNGLAEELAWRGYAFRRLRQGRTFGAAIRWTMPLLAVTHVPILMTRGPAVGSLAIVVAAVTCLPFAYLWERGGKTIWAAAMLHASIDAFKLVEVPTGDEAVMFSMSLGLVAWWSRWECSSSGIASSVRRIGGFPLPPTPDRPVSRELDSWLEDEGDEKLGSLVALFGQKSFRVLFILLLGLPALPIPTGGATHVLEAVAALLALELVDGVKKIWLPQRWRDLHLAGGKRERFIAGLLRMIRRLERFSRPRGRFLFDHRLTNIIFGLLVVCGCVGAFFAPPFTGLDTLPALGVVLLSLGIMLEDFAIVVMGFVAGAVGIVLELVLGKAVIEGIQNLL